MRRSAVAAVAALLIAACGSRENPLKTNLYVGLGLSEGNLVIAPGMPFAEVRRRSSLELGTPVRAAWAKDSDGVTATETAVFDFELGGTPLRIPRCRGYWIEVDKNDRVDWFTIFVSTKKLSRAGLTRADSDLRQAFSAAGWKETHFEGAPVEPLGKDSRSLWIRKSLVMNLQTSRLDEGSGSGEWVQKIEVFNLDRYPFPVASLPDACRGTIGIEIGPLSKRTAEKLTLPAGTDGAPVVELLPGSPAASAGVHIDDLVTGADEETHLGDDVLRHLIGRRTCDPVTIKFQRAGTTHDVTITPVNGIPFYKTLCDSGNATGCYRFATLANDANAAQILEKACKAGSAEACLSRGMAARACDLGSGRACQQLELYAKSCEIGDPRTCYEAALTLTNHARAAQLYDIACRSGRAMACTNLGFQYERGDGVAKDVKRAAELYELACGAVRVDKPHGLACYNLSNFLREGIGVAADKVRAELLMQHACDLGVQEACAAIRKPSS